MQTDLLDTTGKKTGKIELSDKAFNATVNSVLMAQATRVFLANQRQGTQSTKTRGEVAGSGRKIYRQKGTGNARHGDRYAPIFVGGGIAFGPKPRDFSLKMTKKMKKKALFSALSQKQKEKKIFIIENLNKIEPKTKTMAKILENLGLTKDKKKQKQILIVLPERLTKIILAARNLNNVVLTSINLLNAYQVLKSDRILFLKEAIEKLNSLLSKENQTVTQKHKKGKDTKNSEDVKKIEPDKMSK